MTLVSLTRWRRLAAILLLGMASGLPLALSGQAMQAWLTVDGVDIVTIGFLGLVGLPYTFKFLWAPLMDRFEPPWLGRRRGWLVITQALLALVLYGMSQLVPHAQPAMFALMAVLVAFLSASQDVVVDAYRTDVLSDRAEHGLGASVHVFGYRLGMILSGGIALIWADQWDWPTVYRLMAALMLAATVVSAFFAPRVNAALRPPGTVARHDLYGFAAMVAALVGGVLAARLLLTVAGFDPDSTSKWVQLLFVMAEIAAAIPLALWAARQARFDTFNQSLSSYFTQQGATAFLVLIVLYKLGDAFAGSLTTPFLLKGMGFTQAEVGIANKIIGIWLTIIGAFVGGLLMLHLKLYRSLLVFGVLQLISNIGFYVLAQWGKGAWGAVMVPAFDGIVVALREPASLDWLLLAVIAGENISGGMGTVAFVALLMALCNSRFTATHYALLSAFAAVGRIYVSPLAGVLSQSLGWPGFFIFSVILAVPGVVAVYLMRESLRRLAQPQRAAPAED